MERFPILEKSLFDQLFEKYHTRGYVHPDPLEFLYSYEDKQDREIAGLIAALLAYGRVAQILDSVGKVLRQISPPRKFLEQATAREIHHALSGFKHRFTTAEALAWLLNRSKWIINQFGSLEACFRSRFSKEDSTVLPALSNFVSTFTDGKVPEGHWIIPNPDRGGACKRLHLYLRWMVRQDEVDPGGWQGIPKSKLLIPLDVHMHRLALLLGLTGRKQADLKAVLEVTEAFQTIAPDDPVRYDFALTRLGIRPELNLKETLREYLSEKPGGKKASA